MSKYYVYGCYVEEELKYIGHGCNNRWKHCVSGTSSCSELNRDFHEGKVMRVDKLYTKLSKEQAQEVEEKLIAENFETLYNKVIRASNSNNPAITKKKEFKILAHNMSATDAEQKLYNEHVSDLSECIFDLEVDLLSDGLGIFVVKHGNSKPMIVIDKITDGMKEKYMEYNLGHMKLPNTSLRDSLDRCVGY